MITHLQYKLFYKHMLFAAQFIILLSGLRCKSSLPWNKNPEHFPSKLLYKRIYFSSLGFFLFFFIFLWVIPRVQN